MHQLATASVPVLLLSACAEGGGKGDGRLETIEVTGGQQRYLVDFFNRGGGERQILVSSAGYRGLDRSEGNLAFQVASQAGQRAACADGQGVRVLPDSATYVPQSDGFSPIANASGGNVWQFRGVCGG
ncbi:MAG: hypothetical protein AAF503_11840 [Pseudomonadota bacterium]